MVNQELLFAEVNKAEPVKLVDLVAKPAQRNVIDVAVTKLHEDFPDMFSSSQRCRVPHVNVDNLRDALFAANLHKDIGTGNALYKWLLEQNEELGKEYEKDPTSVSASAWKKAAKFGFYLGLVHSPFLLAAFIYTSKIQVRLVKKPF